MLRMLVFRRPEFLLLASLLVFAVVMIVRQATPVPSAAPAALDTTAPLPVGSERSINTLKARVRADPQDAVANAQLGLALLQRVRETADVTLYAQATQALDAAIKIDPKQIDALIGQGTLALAQHRFSDALDWGQKAREADTFRAAAYGVIGDALTELGRYDEAAAAIDKMVATRPDLSSYSRIAYQRELHGNVDGAIQAFELAISAGGPATENTSWTQVQLGNLYFNRGQLDLAQQQYAGALASRTDDPFAIAGLAKVSAARGDLSTAINSYEQITQRLPLPEFVIALGDLYAVTGHPEKARAQYEIVRAIQKLNASAGMNVDMELALFEADHGGDPAATVERARAAYSHRPSIHAADVLAWALYRNGQQAEAARYSAEALRLGTRDAAMLYRAGVIANTNGDTAAARAHLQEALATNPHFSILDAGKAQALLVQLGR